MSRRSELVFYVRLIQGRKKTRIDLTGRVLSFTYEDLERKADKCSLEVDNWDLKNFDTEVWATGKLLEVSWGYVGAMAPARQVVIKSVKGSSRLKIECVEKSFTMDKIPRRRTFVNQTRADMARTIAEASGYGSDVQIIQDTEQVVEGMSQANMTDAAFMRKLCQKEGFEFYIDFDGFHFHERNMKQPPAREFIWYSDKEGKVISFNIENDLTVRKFATVVKGRDLKKKKNFNATIFNEQQLADMPTEERVSAQTVNALVNLGLDGVRGAIDKGRSARDGFSEIVRNAPSANELAVVERRNYRYDALGEVGGLLDADEIKAEVEASAEADARLAARKAKGKLRRTRQLTVKMKMQVVGEPLLLAKTVIRCGGIGKRLSGNYYCKGVKHTISGSGYTCDLQLIRDGKNRESVKLFKAGPGGGGGGLNVDLKGCKTEASALRHAESALRSAYVNLRKSGLIPDDREPRMQKSMDVIFDLVYKLQVKPVPNDAQVVERNAMAIRAHAQQMSFVFQAKAVAKRAQTVVLQARRVAYTCSQAYKDALGEKSVNDARVISTNRRIVSGNRRGTEHARKNWDGTTTYKVVWDSGPREPPLMK